MIVMENRCRFCDIIKENKQLFGIVDKPFLREENFFSLVSIGAFLPGWTLLVSREHKYNLLSYYGNVLFYDYLERHIRFLRSRLNWSGRVIVFEHGANCCDSLTACGTSHAHLHVVLWNDSILDEILREKEWKIVSWGQVPEIVGDAEYLLYCENPEDKEKARVYVHIVKKPESQYFRRLLAEKVGLKGDYSYKMDSRMTESVKIREKLGK